MGVFQLVAGWWGHQRARRAVGGAPPPTISLAVRQIEMHPPLCNPTYPKEFHYSF